MYDGYEDSDDDFFYQKVENKGLPNEKISKSRYHMRLKLLKDNYAGGLTPGTNRQTVNRYTRTYCMDLFGSVMFPNANSSSVPIMYL